ncbi:cytochrome P450 [Gonapodya prolifera JEL478]|uniref:Cytochrome P450 n=1 Tax=Gonapodya prolifera (strain JEL478) TaxID=1344416 RepID=A0A139AVJ7_GONPJ|nr:cytochrome P450 [Gonapodya prolifera JEL478]|eukprot:KXS20761.1 cytochrome P450 [Gonapodya prolifera JEL478]
MAALNVNASQLFSVPSVPLALPTSPAYIIASILVAVLVANYISKIVYELYLSPLRDVPMDWKLIFIPFYGLAWTVSGKSHLFYLKMHRNLGSVVRLNTDTVSVSDPDVIRWLVRDLDIRKNKFYDVLGDPLKSGDVTPNLLTLRDRSVHKELRSKISPAFSIKYLAGLEPQLQEILKEVDAKVESSRVGGSKWASLNIEHLYHAVTVDFIAATAFGQSLHVVKNGTHLYLQQLAKVFFWTFMVMSLPFAGIHKLPQVQQLRGAQETLVKSFIDERKRDNAGGKRRADILQILLDKDLSPEITRSNAGILMAAGSDTTANSLTWATYFLLQHPVALQKLRLELDDAFPEGPDTPLTLTKLKTLPFLTAVIKETLRLRPVASKITRVVDEDLIFECTNPDGSKRSCRIPSGTDVNLFSSGLHRNPRLWVRPDDFWPDRWLSEKVADEEAWGIVSAPATGQDNRLEEISSPQNTYLEGYMPFSFGARDCIGRNFAWNELRMVLGHIVHKYDIEPEWDASGPVTEGKEVIMLKPDFNIMVKLRKRTV